MPASAAVLPLTFYSRETVLIARDLLGMHLVHTGPAGRQVGRIVETEAYQGPRDLAAHSSRGHTKRTEVIDVPPPLPPPAAHSPAKSCWGRRGMPTSTSSMGSGTASTS